MPLTTLPTIIDEACQAKQSDGMRYHLGMSVVGRECAREIWYMYRWVLPSQYTGRQLRLFERGKNEEDVFKQLFEQAGIELWTHNKVGAQYQVKDLGGHFSGSLDGVCRNVPELGRNVCVTEFKTHCDKSFKQLVKHRVEKSHFTHYIQGMLYAYYKQLAYTLYCAVNKNDDTLHMEYYTVKEGLVSKYIDRAKYIIESSTPPPRITATETFYKCKMCSYYSVCWSKGAHVNKNCRTCEHSTPSIDRGCWVCAKQQRHIQECPKLGCEHFSQLPCLECV